MKKLERDIDEIKNFVENWRPSCPSLDEKGIRSSFKSSYKQFHALLIWGIVVQRTHSEPEPIRIYFTEVLSDLSHTYFLNICSLYKLSRSSLRSAIENAIRVLLLHRSVDIIPLTSMYDMFARAKHEYKSDTTARALIEKLHAHYGELCKSVHSSILDYLSLEVPFERLSAFDGSSFKHNNEMMRDISSIFNQCAFWLWYEALHECGHKNQDMVLDALPNSIKRAKADNSRIEN